MGNELALTLDVFKEIFGLIAVLFLVAVCVVVVRKVALLFVSQAYRVLLRISNSRNGLRVSR